MHRGEMVEQRHERGKAAAIRRRANGALVACEAKHVGGRRLVERCEVGGDRDAGGRLLAQVLLNERPHLSIISRDNSHRVRKTVAHSKAPGESRRKRRVEKLMRVLLRHDAENAAFVSDAAARRRRR